VVKGPQFDEKSCDCHFLTKLAYSTLLTPVHVKLSASFRYLSGFRALQRFQEHVEFARANSLLQIKVFPFVN